MRCNLLKFRVRVHHCPIGFAVIVDRAWAIRVLVLFVLFELEVLS